MRRKKILACVAGAWKKWAQEKTCAQEGVTPRVFPSGAPALSFTHYFQAPATQARKNLLCVDGGSKPSALHTLHSRLPPFFPLLSPFGPISIAKYEALLRNFPLFVLLSTLGPPPALSSPPSLSPPAPAFLLDPHPDLPYSLDLIRRILL